MKRHPLRAGALALGVGTVAFAVSSLFHPPTFDAWDASHALTDAIEPRWKLDHWALLISILLIHLGLFALHRWALSSRRPVGAHLAFACGTASFVLWLALFVFEATGWPLLAEAAAAAWGGVPDKASLLAADPRGPGAIIAVTRSVWAGVIALGYSAASLLGLAIAWWSCALLKSERFPGWLARVGVVAGVLTAFVQPLALGMPRLGLWFEAPAAAILGLWLLITVWAMWWFEEVVSGGR